MTTFFSFIMAICAVLTTASVLCGKKTVLIFLSKLKNYVIVWFVIIGSALVTIFFFYLSFDFVYDDAPIKRINLFKPSLYLFNMFAYGFFTIALFESKKEMLDSLQNPKQKKDK